LPIDIIKKFKILLSRRIDVDYGDFDSIDADDGKDSLKSAKEIIETIDIARKEMIADPKIEKGDAE